MINISRAERRLSFSSPRSSILSIVDIFLRRCLRLRRLYSLICQPPVVALRYRLRAMISPLSCIDLRFPVPKSLCPFDFLLLSFWLLVLFFDGCVIV
jgi:hypothetical protein